MRVNARRSLGFALALLSAMGFALNVVCVSLVFEHGGNIHAVNVVRPWFFLLCLVALSLLRGDKRSLPPPQRYASLFLGLVLCVEIYAVHSAIWFIPVGLAILIMYTYPIVVTLAASALARQAPSARLLAAVVVAFSGLALALHTPLDQLDWRGIALGALAALGMTLLVMISERTMQAQSRMNVMIHTNLSACLVMLAIALSGLPLQWPHDLTGMLALVGSTTLYVFATFLLFIAVSMIGPVRFSVIDNTAPVWAILFGFVLLGESLGQLQYLGAALVVCGVIAVQLLYKPQIART